MNTHRIIDDAMLSAFLDSELPAQDMQAVRAALASDPVLAERYAALKLANDLVARHAGALDATPMPSSVLALLQAESATAGQRDTKVVHGPWRMHWKQHANPRIALAASVVLALVLVSNYLRGPEAESLPPLANYAAQLDTNPSGTSVAVDGATLVNRFSFRDNEGRYCRQYQLGNTATASENIACRAPGGWTLIATLPVTPTTAAGYQPASSSNELNALLDSLMQGAALDLAAEAAVIENGWDAD